MSELEAITAGRRRFVVWDGALWWRTYREGGFDGYRTLTGRRLACGALAQRVMEKQKGYR